MRFTWLLLALPLILTSCSSSPPPTAPTATREKGPVTVVNDANFEKEVLQSEQPVLVDFWASWCGPCRMIAPAVEEASAEMKGKVRFAKVDVDAAKAVAAQNDIESLPTLVLFHKGKEIDRFVGAPRGNMTAAITAWVDSKLTK